MSAKSIYLLHQSVDQMLCDRSFFLTLTFADDVSPKEAGRRFNSFRQWLMTHAESYVCVIEPTKRGRPHLHLVVNMRTLSGANYPHEDVARNDYRRVPKAIRRFWAALREALPAYGFGYRHDCQPVRGRGISGYLAKYLGKGLSERPATWRGIRLVRMSRAVSAGTQRFVWATPYMRAYRAACYLTYMRDNPGRLDRWHFGNASYLRDLATKIYTSGVDIVISDEYYPTKWLGMVLRHPTLGDKHESNHSWHC